MSKQFTTLPLIPTVGIAIPRIGTFTRRELPKDVMFPGSHLINGFMCKRFCLVITDDPTHHGLLRHASLSHDQRYPTWDEIKSVRDTVFPSDIDVMMVLPKAQDYVNVHKNTFHLWQTPEGWDIR